MENVSVIPACWDMPVSSADLLLKALTHAAGWITLGLNIFYVVVAVRLQAAHSRLAKWLLIAIFLNGGVVGGSRVAQGIITWAAGFLQPWLCYFLGTAVAIGCGVHPFLVFAVVYERFIFIEHPLHYDSKFVVRKPYVLVLVLVLPEIIFQFATKSSPIYFCVDHALGCVGSVSVSGPSAAAGMYVSYVAQVSMLFAFHFCYGKLLLAAKKAADKRPMSRAAVRTLTVIAVQHSTFIILPLVMGIASIFVTSREVNVAFYRTCLVLCSLSGVCMSTIYVCLDASYKAALRNVAGRKREVDQELPSKVAIAGK